MQFVKDKFPVSYKFLYTILQTYYKYGRRINTDKMHAKITVNELNDVNGKRTASKRCCPLI